MKLYIALIIILISVLTFYIIDKNINFLWKNENFSNDYGATPNKNNTAWSSSHIVDDKENIDKYDNSKTAGPCYTYNPNNKQVIFGLTTDGKTCNFVSDNNSKKPIIEIPNDNDVKSGKYAAITTPPLDNDCYPNNTNFDVICKSKNPTSGIKEKIPCDNNNSKVICGINYVNGKEYKPPSLITPCINKTDDFDTWCRFYSNKNSVPEGYNINSIGVYKLLEGNEGDCYLTNGKPDKNSARAVCDYNHSEGLPKLFPVNEKISNNIFTDCLPINSNFVSACATIIDMDYKDSHADQIMGYDCNPGYGRAKCLKKGDYKEIKRDNYMKSFSLNNKTKDDLDDLCKKKSDNLFSKFGDVFKKDKNIDEESGNMFNKFGNVFKKNEESGNMFNKLGDSFKKDENWVYSPTKNTWYSLPVDNPFNTVFAPKLNTVDTWKNINIKSLKNMSISFLVDIDDLEKNTEGIMILLSNALGFTDPKCYIKLQIILQNSSNKGFIANAVVVYDNTIASDTNNFTINTLISTNSTVISTNITLITIVYDTDNVSIYYNGNLVNNTKSKIPILEIDQDLSLSILGLAIDLKNKPIQIKNFTIYNSKLSPDAMKSICKLENIVTEIAIPKYAEKWEYGPTKNTWYTFPMMNYKLLERWKNINIESIKNMSILFFVKIDNLRNRSQNVKINIGDFDHKLIITLDRTNPNNESNGMLQWNIQTGIAYDTIDFNFDDYKAKNSPDIIRTKNTANFDTNVTLVTLVYDINNVSIYYNGNLVNNTNYGATMLDITKDLELSIRLDTDDPKNTMQFKNFTIYNSKLSPSEIKRIYAESG